MRKSRCESPRIESHFPLAAVARPRAEPTSSKSPRPALPSLRTHSIARAAAAVLALSGCARPTRALEEGATWVSTEAPPDLAATVSRYEHAEIFGLQNDPHGWRGTTRYTLRADAPGPSAGCSYIRWIGGTWVAQGSVLVVTTPATGTGSFEEYDCPDGRPPRTLPTPRPFARAESPYQLQGNVLRLEQQFGATPPRPVTLTRSN